MNENGQGGGRRRVIGMLALATILFSLAAVPAPAGAAEADALAVATPRGVWVYLGSAIPKDAPYVVSRAVGDGDLAPLASVAAPTAAAETAARAAAFTPYFAGLPHVDTASVQRLWDHVVGHDDVTRLAEPNLPVAHLVCGTAYLDTTVVGGAVYRYRIERGGSAATTPALPYPGGKPGPAVAEVVRAAAAGGAAEIVWRLPAGSEPGGLIASRRAARRGDFAPCDAVTGFYVENDTAYAMLHDSTVQPDALYEYVAVLVDRFANPGAASAPAVVTTFADGDAALVVSFAAEDLGDHRVRLKWTLSDHAYERGLVLYRSDAYDGPFARLIALPAGTRDHTDVVPTANENAYYRIGVGGVTGETLSAVVAAMSTRSPPPLPPQSVRAEPAGAGVRISWEGLGPHILGYHVYRARGGEDWRQVSGLVRAAAADTGDAEPMSVAFVDSASGLDGRTGYRYAVRAVSDGYALSDFSEIATAVPAIAYDLATPQNLRSVMDGPRIMLFWDDLSAREPTLAGYDVLRRPAGAGAFERIHEGGYAPRINYWTDETAAPGAAYDYAVQAYDVNGVRSVPSLPHTVRTAAATILPAPASLRTLAVDGGVSLSWSEVFDERVGGYRVYRRDVGGADTRLTEVDRAVLDWIDTAARIGATYVYGVSVVDADGVESAVSLPASGRRER